MFLKVGIEMIDIQNKFYKNKLINFEYLKTDECEWYLLQFIFS